MADYTAAEKKLLRSLSTPAKIQDYLNSIPINLVDGNDTCMSPRVVMREGKAQCMEGAMLAAAAFRFHGQRPLILDLTAANEDCDHVVAVFKQHGCWGATSKTNHAVLRYREPIYRTVRELALSYFHEYFKDNGKKTLRSYSLPVDLSRFDKDNWETSEEPVWQVPEHLVTVRHFPLLTKAQIRTLRSADRIEIEAGKLVDYPQPGR